VPREPEERALIAGVQRELLTEAALQQFSAAATATATAELTRAADADADADGAKRRLADATNAHENIMAAIRAGILTPSTRAELMEAEVDVEAAKAELASVKAFQPAQILPRARETWRRLVISLAEVTDTVESRDALRELIDESVVVTKRKRRDL